MSPQTESSQTETHPAASSSQARRWWIKLLLPPALFFLAGVLLLVGLGMAQRLGWISGGAGSSAASASAGAAQQYICPMMCTPPQSEPGRCPVCGMELVPASSGGGDLGELEIAIEPAARRVANIQTVAVRSTPLKRQIRTIGSLSYDEGRLATIAAYVDGRVERLYADYTGVQVRQGDSVAVLYSPQLYGAQVEFLEASKSRPPGSTSSRSSILDVRRELLEGSKEKLLELGMSAEQLQELEQSGQARRRLEIRAPIGGTVIEKLAVEGQYLETGEAIYRIADLSTVWLLLELFPEDAANIRYGQRVEAEVPSLPGQKFSGRVAFVDPRVNPKTRTVGVRVVLDNSHGRLRVGDYATARIEVELAPADGFAKQPLYDAELAGKWISPRHPHVVEDDPGQCSVCGIHLVSATEFGFSEEPVPQPGVLVVPRDAVLMAGNHSVVYVETQPGRFEVRSVVLGPMSGNQVVIQEGVREGEQVATSGNFLIDSQTQLAGKPSLIDPTRAQGKKPGPLQLEMIQVTALFGQVGTDLEQLYQAYFAVQATLAADQAVAEDQAQALHAAAQSLLASESLAEDLGSLVQTIGEHSERLHQQEIGDARESFKPISQAVIRLAARARGAGAEQPFLQYYCSMVKGDQGDWLQSAKPLANPYWGSKMLRCGELVETLPAPGQ